MNVMDRRRLSWCCGCPWWRNDILLNSSLHLFYLIGDLSRPYGPLLYSCNDCRISNFFDNQKVVSVIFLNICWFQILKCQDFMLFCVIYDRRKNVLGVFDCCMNKTVWCLALTMVRARHQTLTWLMLSIAVKLAVIITMFF